MTILLTIAAFLAFIWSGMLWSASVSAVHQILAALVLLMSIVMVCTATLLYRIDRALPKHLE